MPSQSLSDEALAAIESSLVFTYVMQVTVTVMIWDIVIHIGDDVELLSLPGRLRPPTVVYFLSRFLFLIYFCVVTTDTAPAACQSTLVLTSSATNFIAQVFTLLQFFLRVRVIYCEGSRLKTGLFAALWVLASGGASLSVDFLGRSACTSYNPRDTGLSVVDWEMQNKCSSWRHDACSVAESFDFSYLSAILVPLHSVVLNVTTGHVFREVRLGRMKERELTLPLAFQQSEVPVEGILPLHPMHRDENAEESPS
ncbi:hypothetical protein BDP27DRAFT_1365098 [Rhodocollybia butyracea]|uniref:DUF6533 domain-containing protein n=1 Tax=Rhodocollybia butyracea TaxID=206335 RepID=A0A9P5PNG7_9AGAR|nr:hypothetical protein BDP27DRAFT_1365098 [Rhodocollybia butyracea]